MSASSISLALLIVLSAVLLLRWMRKMKPQTAKLGSQKICPFCGLITPRFKANCVECGKPFTAVAYSIFEEMNRSLLLAFLKNFSAKETMKNIKFIVKVNRGGSRAPAYVQRVDATPIQMTTNRKLALLMGKFTAEDAAKSLQTSQNIPELVSVPVPA